MKKLFKILMILAAVFVVLLVGLIITIKVMYPPAKVRALVEQQASKFAKRDIQIKGASLSLFPTLGITIEGVRISNTQRNLTLDKPMSLWALLDRDNLKKEGVLVKVNGKEVEEVAEKDQQLKAGDKLWIARKGFNEKEALFSLKKLVVSVKVMPLLSKKVEIKRILLDELGLLVQVDRRGSFNFDDLLGKKPAKDEKPKVVAKKPPTKADKKGGALPISLKLNAFEIKNSKISYLNQKTGQNIVLDDINQNLAVKFNTTLTNVISNGLFEIKKMSVSGRGIPVRKSGVYFMIKHDVKVDVKAGNLTINQFTVGFQKTFITTKGTVNGYDKKVRHLDLAIKTNKLKLQDLFKEVPPAMFPQARKMSVKGNTLLSIKIKGKMDSRVKGSLPSINGLFQIMQGEFKYADLPKSVNNINTDIAFTQDSLNIKKFAFNLGSDPVSLVAKIDHFKKPVVDAVLKASVNLANLKDAVKLPKGVTAKGQIKADIKAKGKVEPKNPAAMDVAGTIDFINIVATTPQVKKPVELNGTFKLSNTEINLEKLETKIGRSSFTMELKVRDYLGQVLKDKKFQKMTLVTYTLNSPLLDLNEMLGVKKGTSKGTSTPAKTTKTADSSGGRDTGNDPINIPNLPNVKFVGKIRVKKLIYSTLPITNAGIDLNFANKIIRFKMSANLFEGRINEDLTLNLSNKKQIRMRNKFFAKKMEANDFISNFNDIPNNDGKFFSKLKSMDNTVYGKLDIISDVTSYGITKNQLKKNLSGTLNTKIHRGKIKNATIFQEMTASVPKLLKKFFPKLNNFRMNRPLQMETVIKNGKLIVKKLAIPTPKFSLAGYGTIGLDSVLDMKMDVELGRSLSRKILRQQKRLQRAAKGLLGRVGGGGLLGKLKSQAGGMIGKMQLIPTNKRGRVVPVIGSMGSLSKILHKFLGFKGKSDSIDSGDDSKKSGLNPKKLLGDVTKKAKKAAQKAAKRAKREAMKIANAAKARAMKAANAAKAAAGKAAADAKRRAAKAANDAKKRVRQQAAKQKKQLQQKAKKLKKDALKGFGF